MSNAEALVLLAKEYHIKPLPSESDDKFYVGQIVAGGPREGFINIIQYLRQIDLDNPHSYFIARIVKQPGEARLVLFVGTEEQIKVTHTLSKAVGQDSFVGYLPNILKMPPNEDKGKVEAKEVGWGTWVDEGDKEK